MIENSSSCRSKKEVRTLSKSEKNITPIRRRVKMKKYARLLLSVAGVMCMLLVVSGCGPRQPETNPYERMSKADMKYQNVQVANFTITPRGVQETGDVQGILAESQSACIETLVGSNLFTDVKRGSNAERVNSALIVQGELTRLKIVGGGARFWIGAWAGKSEMAVYVKLINASTGQVIAEKEIRDDTDPSVGAMSIGANDRALPAQIGRLVADLVINAARK
jgi:ABC-type uncharacterized transport system auxiliary subunit